MGELRGGGGESFGGAVRLSEGGSESRGSPHKGAQHYTQEPFSIDQ